MIIVLILMILVYLLICEELFRIFYKIVCFYLIFYFLIYVCEYEKVFIKNISIEFFVILVIRIWRNFFFF